MRPLYCSPGKEQAVTLTTSCGMMVYASDACVAPLYVSATGPVYSGDVDTCMEPKQDIGSHTCLQRRCAHPHSTP